MRRVEVHVSAEGGIGRVERQLRKEAVQRSKRGGPEEVKLVEGRPRFDGREALGVQMPGEPVGVCIRLGPEWGKPFDDVLVER